MSTYYYGKIVRNRTVTDVFLQIKSNYGEFHNKFNSYIKKEFVKFVYKKIDGALIDDKKNEKKDIFNLKDEYSNIIYSGNKNIVNQVVICLFPYKKNTLVMNCSDFLYNDIFNSFGFEDYSYWDNSDKPDDISNREWKKRLEVWDMVCPDIPANTSLVYAPYFQTNESFPLFWKFDDLKEYFEKYSVEKRFEKYCKNHEFANEYFKKNKPNPWLAVKDKMFDITEENFKDVFNCKK